MMLAALPPRRRPRHPLRIHPRARARKGGTIYVQVYLSTLAIRLEARRAEVSGFDRCDSGRTWDDTEAEVIICWGSLFLVLEGGMWGRLLGFRAIVRREGG